MYDLLIFTQTLILLCIHKCFCLQALEFLFFARTYLIMKA